MCGKVLQCIVFNRKVTRVSLEMCIKVLQSNVLNRKVASGGLEMCSKVLQKVISCEQKCLKQKSCWWSFGVLQSNVFNRNVGVDSLEMCSYVLLFDVLNRKFLIEKLPVVVQKWVVKSCRGLSLIERSQERVQNCALKSCKVMF